MAQGKRVGIRYIYDENWVGGAYYIQNLIRSLNYLPKKEQIELYILANDKQVFKELKNATGYPKLIFVRDKIQYTKFEIFINRVSYKILKKKIILKKIELDWLFPLYSLPENLKHIENLIFWIPDLQEKCLPDFFSEEEIRERTECCNKMIELNCPIVFSSYTARNDFNTFYPHSKNYKNVLQFAVVHQDLEVKDIDEVKRKYSIMGDYFFSPNQFWQHKNQIAIIEAVKILKEKRITVQVVFTGKEHDYRNADYTTNLKRKVADYKLENEIIFLGFIDRKDQLILMKNAQAIIQPSFFEGWSTVVEDAKALNQTLIVSDIAVHKEQLMGKGYFFSPNDYNDLALKMLAVSDNPVDKLKYDLDYSEKILDFALNLKLLISANLNDH